MFNSHQARTTYGEAEAFPFSSWIHGVEEVKSKYISQMWLHVFVLHMHSRWSQVCSLGLHVEMCLHFISLDALPDIVWTICASTTVKIYHMPDSFCRHSTKKRCVHRDVIGFASIININEMDTQRHAWVYSKMRCIGSCSIDIKFSRHMERHKPFHFLHEFMV